MEKSETEGARVHEAAFSDADVASVLAEVRNHAILMLDVDGHVATWNSGAERFTGYASDEIVGRPWSILHPAEAIAAGTPARLLAAARAQGRAEHEGWQMRRDGSRVWGAVVVAARFGEIGELRGYGTVIRDLTERNVNEERFRAAFTHAPIGIAISDLREGRDGRFIEVNPAPAHMLGYEANELVGAMVTSVTHQHDREAPTLLLARLLEGSPVSVEMRLVHRDGHEVWALVSATPLPEPPGEAPRSAISQILDISERKRFESRLRHLADHDALTGLFNRHRFESELDRVIDEAGRYGRSAALVMIDLDGFKDVNDRFGHPAGDELVCRLAALLRDVARTSDVIARLGGDEFAIVLSEVSAHDAELLATRILEAIREHGRVAVGQRRARVTASVGLTTFDATTGLTGAELVIEADGAMYEAKSRGRDRHAVHERAAAPSPPAGGRHSWMDRLRCAVEEDRFVLHAQPIVAIAGSGVPPRYELLLRLHDDQGRLMPPGAFLYNAERFDLMGDIDRWVLRQAIELLDAHRRAGNDLGLAVNISGKTMNDSELPGDLAAMLEEHPLEPGRLVIEVTETAAIVNIARARELAADLRELGCGFALDDFGSGFASFYYLKHLEFDFLKLDGEFVRQLADTPTDQLVVGAVVDIARGLGTRTVAESVGDAPTLELLRSLGIDYGQGYHLGRPGPLADVLPPLPAAPAGGLAAGAARR